ncbi:hypothetical protein N4G70_28745 [Streptomyces sp. ASQP_92]|uniref:hypothetical protein n=1 Tax=Streptomyces sp. ASQP_92 TaxID=2979116 RepID=UPI0021C1BF7F|nr:hypothetical protein [Streptomyces sp. ASQP_92]MCT9092829.1 hypothetical protein [Streptomyces sp. ASQP_92]
MKNWFAQFGSAHTNKVVTAYDIRPDVAEAFIAGVQGNIAERSPRHGVDFPELIATIAQASRVIQGLEELREHAMAAADRTSPHADRKAIAIAAGMPPSRLYRVLEKHGQPRNRKTDTASRATPTT